MKIISKPKILLLLVILGILLFVTKIALGHNEDLGTYTEVDANNKLTTTTDQALADDVDRDEDVLLYYDYGTDNFDDLLATSTTFMGSGSSGDALGLMGFTATSVDDLSQWSNTDVNALWGHWAVDLYITLGELKIWDNWAGPSEDTPYYLLMEREAGNTNATLKIYDDEARTSLVDTLSVAGLGTTKYRYFYAFGNLYTGAGGNDFDGYFEDIDIGEEHEEEGGSPPPATENLFTEWIEEAKYILMGGLAFIVFLYFMKYMVLIIKSITKFRKYG